MNPQLEYAGEAVVLVGIAFRLLRWAFDAAREGDAPPSAPIDLTISDGPVQKQTLHWSNKFTFTLTGNDQQLPPEMLAALTPEQREKVLETIAKMRAGGQPDTKQGAA